MNAFSSDLNINPMRQTLVKVPEITLYFWVIKVLTTGMGETTSDYLVRRINPVVAVTLGFIGLVIALALQFSVKKYVAWTYWLAVIMVAVFGTMAADVLHIGLGIPYLISTIFFTAALIIIFMLWYTSEKTLSIHSITTRRREIFYWAAVLTTFALGTAAGDMTASTMHLGYFSSGALFSLLIALVAIAHFSARAMVSAEQRGRTRNAVLAFWLAYILTRPLGASFADWVGVPASRGGLNWGTGFISLVLFIIIACLVSYLSVSRKDTAGPA